MQLPSLSECAAAVDRLAPVLLDVAVRGVLVLGLTGAAALAMRRASAAARHWVWLLGMVGLLLLPVLSATVPGWRILPRMEIHRAEPVITTIITPPSIPSPSEFVAAVPPGVSDASTNVRTDSATLPPRQAPPIRQQMQAQPAQAALMTQAIASPQPIPRTPLSWTFWIAISWLGGALLITGYVLLGYFSLWLLQRRCTRVDQTAWSSLLSELRQELEVHRAVQLLISPLRTMPMTWGLWRTRLLLPEQSTNWQAEQRRSVLLHELAHVRRFDCFTQLLSQITCAVYWFNPLVWVAWHRMQIERERACDDLVLRTGAKASAYANHLLVSASDMLPLRFVSAAALAMARPSMLEERIRTILDPNRNRGTLSLRSAIATILLLVTALVPVAALQAQQQAPTPAEPAPTPTAATAQQPDNQNVSLEERMRIRRLQQTGAEGAAGSTTSPAASRVVPFTPGGRGRGPVVFSDPAVLPTPGNGPMCALDAVIYDVRIPIDLIGRLDPDALGASATTVDDFEKALARLGTAQPLYRVNQSVRLERDSIDMGQSTPYVTGSVRDPRGQIMNAVSYAQTGALFDLTGKSMPAGVIELDLRVQISTLGDSTISRSEDTKAPIFRRIVMSHKGPIKPAQPFVFVSADGAVADSNGKAVAYIARVTMGAPQAGSRPEE